MYCKFSKLKHDILSSEQYWFNGGTIKFNHEDACVFISNISAVIITKILSLSFCIFLYRSFKHSGKFGV